MLSLEQIRKYLRTGGNYCPFCGSDQISSDPVAVPSDDSESFALVKCTACKKQWKDLYKLVSIEEVV